MRTQYICYDYYDTISSFNYLRYLMTQLKLIGAKLLQTLWEHTITLSGQLEQEKENVIFWNLKMLE